MKYFYTPTFVLLTLNNAIGELYTDAIASLVSRVHNGNCDNICLHS